MNNVVEFYTPKMEVLFTFGPFATKELARKFCSDVVDYWFFLNKSGNWQRIKEAHGW